MADSLTSGSTRTVLSDTASPGYLNNANLSEFPAPPTINIKDEGTPEPQVDAIDMENPPESDDIPDPPIPLGIPTVSMALKMAVTIF